MHLFVKDRSFYKQLITIALPIIGQNAINIGISVADTMMLGSLGEVALSASSLANSYYFLFMITLFGLGGGVGVLTGQYWGQGNRSAIRRMLSTSLLMCFIAAVLYGTLGMLIPQQIMSLYTPETAVQIEGANYLRIVSVASFFHAISLSIIMVFRTVRTVKLTLCTTSISFVLNVFLNWVLIYGNLGAPALGVSGAAIATSISRVVECIIVVVYLFFIDKKLHYKLRHLFRYDGAIFREYIRLGSPVLISDLLLAIGSNMINIVLGQMGSVIVAANSIANVVMQFATVANMGISSAGAVLTGNTIGNGEYKKAKDQGITFLMLSLCVGLLASGIILLVKDFAIGMYNVTLETQQTASLLMIALSVLCIFMPVEGCMTKGVLRGGGDTRFLMVADVLFLWVVSVPLGFLSGLVWHWPVMVVYVLLRIDTVLKAIWCVFRLLSGKWIRVVKEAAEED